MKTPAFHFEEIVNKMVAENHGVERGRMMSSPALKYRNQVFAFFHKDTMTFKLGKEFNPASVDLQKVQWLSPFKHKPPMKAWFVVDETEMEKWERLTQMAFEKMR